MPPKPRPHGKPKPPSAGGDRRTLLLLGAGGVAALALVAVALAFTLGGDDGADATAALEAAGCTLSATPALTGVHSVASPSGKSDKWNTVPPTTGPHYPVPVVYGIYDEQVSQAQLVHNLEHGAIAIQYGDDVPVATVQALRKFAQGRPRGTILAPYAALGDQVALGAWVADDDNPEEGTAYLAKCRTFDEDAFAAFFDAYQFRGPERFPPDALLPGRT